MGEAGGRPLPRRTWVGDATLRGAAEVIVALDPEDLCRLPAVTETLLAAAVPFRLVPSLFEHGYRAAKLSGFDELPLLDMAVDPLDQAQRVLKRALDVVASVVVLTVMSPVLLAAAALVLMSPVLFVVAVAVKATSPGPVLFRQERVGRNGRHFSMLKFRTMVQDAEARLSELAGRNECEGPLFKMQNDPRLTRVGAFLRRWSLDEFPQFLNVLRGEMSVVGPRPPLPREVERYDTHHYGRLKVKPGITGLWQVSGRSDLSFADGGRGRATALGSCRAGGEVAAARRYRRSRNCSTVSPASRTIPPSVKALTGLCLGIVKMCLPSDITICFP